MLWNHKIILPHSYSSLDLLPSEVDSGNFHLGDDIHDSCLLLLAGWLYSMWLAGRPTGQNSENPQVLFCQLAGWL